jgi:hypothetical protein
MLDCCFKSRLTSPSRPLFLEHAKINLFGLLYSSRNLQRFLCRSRSHPPPTMQNQASKLGETILQTLSLLFKSHIAVSHILLNAPHALAATDGKRVPAYSGELHQLERSRSPCAELPNVLNGFQPSLSIIFRPNKIIYDIILCRDSPMTNIPIPNTTSDVPNAMHKKRLRAGRAKRLSYSCSRPIECCKRLNGTFGVPSPAPPLQDWRYCQLSVGRMMMLE